MERIHATLRAVLVVLLLVLAGSGTAASASTPGAPPSAGQFQRSIRVPQDQPTIQAAVDASTPGTLILLDRGTYPGEVVVPPAKSGITIRGVDRNEVVLDGADVRANGIVVHADDVAIENMTAHNFTGNAFYWRGVEGYRGRYLTVWNVGLYGIYAIESREGRFEDSFVSGAADAAFYIGECNPCDAVVTNVTARLSAVGYSGTNAGGNLEVRDSLWELNGTAIMPNSFEGQPLPPPQRSSLISGNTIRDSGAVPVPANSPLAGYIGMGVAIAGGWENIVEDNVITGSATYGIGLFPTVQPSGNAIAPQLNVVQNNDISGSGEADLAVAEGSAETNCFSRNAFDSSLPADIETVLACGEDARTPGDPDVLARFGIPIPVLLDQLGDRPSYTEMPAPDRQPTMPGPIPPDTPTDEPPTPTNQPTASPSQSPETTGGPEAPSGEPTAAPTLPVEPDTYTDPDGSPDATIGLVLLLSGAAVVAVLLWLFLTRNRSRR